MTSRFYGWLTGILTAMVLIGTFYYLKPPRSLVIGIHPWIGYEPLYLADQFGWLPPTVSLRPTKTVRDTLTGLSSGELDAGCLTLDETIQLSQEGLSLTIIAVFDMSAGADMLISNSQVNALSDLKGKRIAMEASSVGELIFREILLQGGLKSKDLLKVDLPVDQHSEAWQAGRIDAAISYEPFASQLKTLGGHTLWDSRKLPDTIYDVLVIRSDRLEHRESIIKGLLSAHFRALNYLKTSSLDALYRIAEHHGTTYDNMLLILGGVNLPTLEQNRYYLSAQSPLGKVTNRIAQKSIVSDNKRRSKHTLVLNGNFLPSSTHL